MVEPSGLDADQNQPSGQPAESPAELHDGGEAERVGASGGPASRGQRPRDGVDNVDVAGVTAGADRVRNDDGVGSCPRVESLAGVIELEYVHVEALGCHPAGDLNAHGIVAAVGVTETDHERPHGYCSSTVRSRKCVAHEMHGS